MKYSEPYTKCFSINLRDSSRRYFRLHVLHIFIFPIYPAYLLSLGNHVVMLRLLKMENINFVNPMECQFHHDARRTVGKNRRDQYLCFEVFRTTALIDFRSTITPPMPKFQTAK